MAGSPDGTGQASVKWGNGVFGVLIVIGAIILAAMFFVLYVRAIAAENRADMLSADVAALRDELAKRI
ncbi:MAG: hypothetical protein ACOH12_00655 [Parvibaculaceae bacterium]